MQEGWFLHGVFGNRKDYCKNRTINGMEYCILCTNLDILNLKVAKVLTMGYYRYRQ